VGTEGSDHSKEKSRGCGWKKFDRKNNLSRMCACSDPAITCHLLIRSSVIPLRRLFSYHRFCWNGRPTGLLLHCCWQCYFSCLEAFFRNSFITLYRLSSRAESMLCKFQLNSCISRPRRAKLNALGIILCNLTQVSPSMMLPRR